MPTAKPTTPLTPEQHARAESCAALAYRVARAKFVQIAARSPEVTFNDVLGLCHHKLIQAARNYVPDHVCPVRGTTATFPTYAGRYMTLGLRGVAKYALGTDRFAIRFSQMGDDDEGEEYSPEDHRSNPAMMDLREQVAGLMELLTTVEYAVIWRRYGLHGEAMTEAETAADLGMTLLDVTRHEATAVRKMRGAA